MRPLPNEFTFDDNSTLTSFTELKEHLRGYNVENNAGSDGAHWGSINGADSENIDRRSERNNEKYEDNPKRDGIISNLKPSHSGPRSSSRSNSNSDGTSQSNTQFWASLSAHAASAAIMKSADYNHPNSMAEAAANAAAKSLLEDSQAMEQINAQRLKKKQQQSGIATKPPMKITQQTVRNAATKASIAVLQSGADQEVAAAVASAIIREGGSMTSKNKTNGQILAKESQSTSSSSSTLFSSPSKTYLRNSARRKKKKKNTIVTTNRLESFSTHSSLHSCKPDNNVNPNVEPPPGRWQQEDDATVPSILKSNSRSKSSPSHSVSHSLTSSNCLDQTTKPTPRRWHREDDTTVTSISSPKFGKDKYAMSDIHSVMSGSISKDPTGTSVKNSEMSDKELNNDMNVITEEVLNALRTRIEKVKNEDNVPMSKSKSNLSTADVGSNDTHINKELMNAIREAMMLEKKDDKLDEVSFNSLSSTVASLLVQGSQRKEQQTITSSTTQEDSLSEESNSNKSRGLSSWLLCRGQENMPKGMEMPDQKGTSSLQPEGPDDSTIDPESHHKLPQLGVSALALRAHPSSAYGNSADVEYMTGNGCSSLKNDLQPEQHQPQQLNARRRVVLNKVAENPEIIDNRKHCQLDEKQRLEQKQADLLVAMDLLQKKLNELECCDAGHHSTSSSSNSRIVQPPLVPKRQPLGPPQQYQQLQQLSMLANPAMSAMRETTSSTCTPMTANGNMQPSINTAVSTTSTHYPALPPVATMITVDTAHHGYEHIADANTVTASVASSSTGGGSIPCTSVPAVNSSTPLVRPVLKKPSKCFPIIEMGDELGPDWEEDGAVIMPLGECRIGRSFSTGAWATNKDESEPHGHEDALSYSGTPSFDSDAGHTEGDVGEMEINAVEVVLVEEPNPRSPTARLKRRIRQFFRHQSKKVTFATNDIDDFSESLMPQRTPQSCSVQNEVLPSNVKGEGGTAAGPSLIAPSKASSYKNVGSFATRQRSNLRESFLKTLRRGRIFKLSSSKAKDRGGCAVNGAVLVAAPAIQAIGSTMSDLAVLRGAGNRPVAQSIQDYDTVDTTKMQEAGIQQPPEASNAVTVHSDSGVGSDAGRAENQPPSTGHDTTNWLNSVEDDINSKNSASEDIDCNTKTTVGELEGGVTMAASTYVESCSGSTSDSDTISSSSNGNIQPVSRFAPYEQKSVYISDVVRSFPTYSGDSISEDDWIETVLKKFTTGQLWDNGTDNDTIPSSSKLSAVGNVFS